MSFQSTCTRTITTDKEQKLCHCTLFVIFKVHKQKEMPFQNNVIHDLKQLFYKLEKRKKKKENLISMSATGLNATRLSYVHLQTTFFNVLQFPLGHGTVKLQLYKKYTSSTNSGCNIASTVKRKSYSHL